MRKTVGTIALVLMFLAAIGAVAFLPVKAEPKTITVPDDYPTIQAAIGNATAGDTVFVKEGIYNYSIFRLDGIYIDKPISLIGQNSQKTIISRPYFKYADNVIHIATDNVIISGFTITSSISLIGIRVEDPAGSDSQPSGINIIGNNIVGLNVGILTYGGENYVISQNNITGNDQGASFYSSNSVISDNNITDNGLYGLSIGSCQNVTIKGNNIANNGFKPNVGYGATNAVDQGGLSLDGSNSHVHRNNITKNVIGVQFYGGNNNSDVYNNNILNNQIGVNLENMMLFATYGAGSNTKNYNNNLIDNDKNAFVQHTNRYWNVTAYNETYGEGKVIGNGTTIVSWDNGYAGNYWSDYQTKYPNASEIDSSGIGNAPYPIDENNTDHYPLLLPVDISAEAPQPPKEQEPFPVVPVVAAVTGVVVVSASLVLLCRKRRHKATRG